MQAAGEELEQFLATATTLMITIEHRLVSLITKNWRGCPLTGIRTGVDLIAATKTRTGPAVQCAHDPDWYPTAERISDAEFESIPLRRHNWHGDWNYDIHATT
jgi:hypothetical protein